MQDFSACLRKLTYFAIIWIKAHSHTTFKIFSSKWTFFWWPKMWFFFVLLRSAILIKEPHHVLPRQPKSRVDFYLLSFLFTFFRHFFRRKGISSIWAHVVFFSNQDEVTQRSIFSVRWNLPLFLQFTKRYVRFSDLHFYLSIFLHQKKFVQETSLMSQMVSKCSIETLRKNAVEYYKLWVNDTKNDKVPKINVTTEDINDNLDELGHHGTIGITSKHLLLRNFLRSKGVRVLEARFGSFVPTKLRTEIPTTIRQAT